MLPIDLYLSKEQLRELHHKLSHDMPRTATTKWERTIRFPMLIEGNIPPATFNPQQVDLGMNWKKADKVDNSSLKYLRSVCQLRVSSGSENIVLVVVDEPHRVLSVKAYLYKW